MRGDNHGVNFVFEFYDEDGTFPPFLEKVSANDFDHAYILHDMDIFTDGDKVGQPKKPHYHAIVHTRNDRSLSAICSLLNVQERFCQVLKKGDDISDTLSFLRYMLHADKVSLGAGKHLYSPNDLIGPLADKYCSRLSPRQSKENPEDILKILDFIASSETYLSMDSLIRYSVQEGLYSLLRRSASLVREVLRDHNDALRISILRDGISTDVIEFRQIKDAYNFTKSKVVAAGGNPDNVKINSRLLKELLERKEA